MKKIGTKTKPDSISGKPTIGFSSKPPKDVCKDSRCPWHGSLSVRGRLFTGKVVSDRAQNTAIVEIGYNQYSKKYERYERRTTRIVAHNPDCIDAKIGDTVRICECRKLSKTKAFVVIEKME